MPKDSATRRRTLARKAALASLAGLATACGHETQTVTVEPAPVASATSTATATATVVRRPPPPPDDDDMVVRHPMHGSDPVGPPIVRPPPPPWSTWLGRLSVSSKTKVSRGRHVVEVTIVLSDPLRMNQQPIQMSVTGGAIVEPTQVRDNPGSQSVVMTVQPSAAGPVEIMLGVLDHDGSRTGHARFEVTGASAKVVQLDN